MKVGIIGSEGYIGSYLKEQLLSLNYQIYTCDIKSSSYINHFQEKGRYFNTTNLDVVIYLGGLTGRLACENKDWNKVLDENINDLIVLGKNMNKKQLLIYASTAGILEGSYNNPANENFKVNEQLLDQYTLSMYKREQCLKYLNTNTIGLRFGTVIGISPCQRFDLVHIAMIKSAFINGKIKVQYPKCNRSILWLSDLKNSILQILNSTIYGHYIYNLSSFNTTIEDIAKSISKHTNILYEIDKTSEHNIGFSLNCSKFIKDFNFKFIGTQDIIIKELKENISHICIDNISLEESCRICKNNLKTIIDLGYQPLANNFVTEPCKQDEYPLCLMRCNKCNHTQLNFTVKPEVMFINYQYNSGTSNTLRNYFKYLAEKCIADSNIQNGTVLELACNDGSQLDEFKKLGWKTYGVDPAKNLVTNAINNGHNIYCGFWGIDKIEVPVPDIIIAQNVLAHVPDPVLFLKTCVNCMSNNTLLYIQTSQCNMYLNGEFDTIYHEHLSFFTISSMMKAAELSNLVIINITKEQIHGTSYLFQMKKKNKTFSEHSSQAIEEYNKEKDIGLYSDYFYDIYRDIIKNIKEWIQDKMTECKNFNKKVIAYGAAAKGMTMLNYFNIKNIKYIVDDATMKHNLYTPGTNIKIYPVSKLSEDNDDLCILVLAWNFIDEIVKKIKQQRGFKNTYIIKVFPTQEFFMI